MSNGGDSIELRRRSRALGEDDEQRGTYSQHRTTGPQARFDEDDYPEDPPRRNTSVVRMTGQQSQRLPVPQPPTTPVPARRTTSGNFAPRSTQTRDRDLSTTGRIPRNTTGTYKPTPKPSSMSRGPHWLLPLGIGMIAMLLLFVIGSLIVTWGGQIHDNLVYGTPRTYQTDAVVGHGGDSTVHPSHFIAINYNRQAVVVEWMAGDPSKSVDYVVPYVIVGDNSNLTPVTVTFQDVNGDKKLDMVIHIHMKNQDQTFVFINDGTKFRAPNASDKINL